MKPLYDELFGMVQLLSKANFELQEENKGLQKRIKDLEERLNLNSKNSSKPPSTDQKKNKKKPRGGAVLGHPGRHHKLLDKIDKRIIAAIEQCEHCGSKDIQVKAPYITQQIEVPDIKPFVTQIERGKAKCRACGKNLVAPMPEGYDNSSFGPKLISVIGVCSSAYRMSKRTIQILLKTLLGNAEERTLRHIVLWRKTSYGTQSEEGSRFLERAISIWMTLKKQSRDVLPFFQQAYLATFHPKSQIPAI